MAWISEKNVLQKFIKNIEKRKKERKKRNNK